MAAPHSPIAMRSKVGDTSLDTLDKVGPRSSLVVSVGPLGPEVSQLESERRRLELGLRKLEQRLGSLSDDTEAVRRSREERLKAFGKYDRFFQDDGSSKKKGKGHHPLGRAKAVLETRTIIGKKLVAAETARARALTKFNTAVTANAAVRTRIDLLRREMIVFRNLFTTMEAELQRTKKATTANNTTIEDYYDARDSAQLDMTYLKQDMEQTRLEIQEEWDLLTGVIDAAPSPSMVSKTPAKPAAVKPAPRSHGRQQRGGPVPGPAEVSPQTTLQSLRQQWETIVKGTDVDSPEALAAEFEQLETEKFSKATAVTQFVSEVEALERRLRELSSSVRVDQKERRTHTDKRSHTEEAMSKQVDDAKHSVEAVQKATVRKQQLFKALVPPIQAVYIKLGGEKMFLSEASEAVSSASDYKSKLPSMFNSPVVRQSVRQGVTTHNLPQFVGIIEQRSAEVMQQYGALFPPGASKSLADTSKSGMGGSPGGRARSPYASSPTNSVGSTPSATAESNLLNQSAVSLGPSEPPGRLKVHVRSSAMRAAMLDGDKDDDDIDVPMTREEMKMRAAAHMSKPANVAARTAAMAAAQVLTASRPLSLTTTPSKRV